MSAASDQRKIAWEKERASLVSQYIALHGRTPNLDAPRRYTEKILWRKLYDLNPLFPVFCDKLAVRDYIAKKIDPVFLTPLLWKGSDPHDIPFDDLVPPYVIKSSHASGHVLMIQERADVQPMKICNLLEVWLADPHAQHWGEIAYRHVPRQILIERQVFDGSRARPLEHRCFVFGGRVRVINTVFIENCQVRNGAFHTPTWERLPWYFSRALTEMDFPKPAKLREIIRLAERLGRGSEHLRIDFFDAGEPIWVGEITVYPWSGRVIFQPDEADTLLGDFWQLPGRRLRAWMTQRLRDRDISLPGQAHSRSPTA